mmetsp:Transcript_55810/g.130765  ORF Transcript_55810/g.130765 Transcript_55810/m.130765 type:complete len:81 (-) Transcript_55810:248-490(-)
MGLRRLYQMFMRASEPRLARASLRSLCTSLILSLCLRSKREEGRGVEILSAKKDVRFSLVAWPRPKSSSSGSSTSGIRSW